MRPDDTENRASLLWTAADVCEILEGGEAAFKERARHLRVRMPKQEHELDA